MPTKKLHGFHRSLPLSNIKICENERTETGELLLNFYQTISSIIDATQPEEARGFNLAPRNCA
jgi:hypothetical protein